MSKTTQSGDSQTNPTTSEVNLLLSQAIDQDAELLTIDPTDQESIVSIIRYGTRKFIQNLPKRSHERILSHLKTMAKLRADESRLPQTGRAFITSKQGIETDLYIDTLPTIHGETATIQLLPRNRRKYRLDQLGSKQAFAQLKGVLNESGLIVIAGPTRSGLTTTLYSILDHKKQEQGYLRAASLERQVAQPLKGVNQVETVNNAANESMLAEAIFRAKPDLVLIDPLHETGSMKKVLREVNQGGKLVIASMYADNPRAVERRLTDAAGESLVRYGLQFVLTQRLVRLLCSSCKVPVEASREQLYQIFTPSMIDNQLTDQDTLEVYESQGCDVCHQGYRGHTVIAQHHHGDSFVAYDQRQSLFQEHNGINAYSLFEYLRNGEVSLSDAQRVTA